MRLQPPASDLCSPSGRFYSTHISYASLPSVLASTFQQSGREFFFPHQSTLSKHQESLGTKSTLSHRAALDLVLPPHLKPPTNHPGKILASAFIFSLLLNQTCPWLSLTGHLQRESSLPHKWIKAPGVYSEKRQQSLGASFNAQALKIQGWNTILRWGKAKYSGLCKCQHFPQGFTCPAGHKHTWGLKSFKCPFSFIISFSLLTHMLDCSGIAATTLVRQKQPLWKCSGIWSQHLWKLCG